MNTQIYRGAAPAPHAALGVGNLPHRSCACARTERAGASCPECQGSSLRRSSWHPGAFRQVNGVDLESAGAGRAVLAARPGAAYDFGNLPVFPRLRGAMPAYQGDGGAPSPAPPVSAPAPAATGLGAGAISGGVKVLTMDVTGKYTPCTDCADGLEAIQVFWGTRRTDGVKVGKTTTAFPPLAADYDTFVDGGKNSPGGAVYTGDHPYYIGRPDLPKSYGYVGGQGSAGRVAGCTANPTDTPAAATLHQEAYFETAFVCLNYQGAGKDKIMDSFQWGFVDRGKTFKPSPYLTATDIVKHSTPTDKFLETLKSDYSGYSLVT